MKRDMDLVRALLLFVESDPKFDGRGAIPCFDAKGLGFEQWSNQEVMYHLDMLLDAGYLTGKRSSIAPIVSGLSMPGHDFLDSVRDPVIWEKTKDAAKSAGGFTLTLLGDLAKGFLRTQVEKHTGLKLE